MGMGLGVGSRRFELNGGFGKGGGGRTVGARDDDFMQKPAFGAKSMRTVDIPMHVIASISVRQCADRDSRTRTSTQ